MYDRVLTEISKGCLVEILLELGAYRQDIVLVGGWAPYFLTQNYFDHCGSIDIDFVLNPSIMIKYQSIEGIIRNLGYIQTSNIFRWKRTITNSNTKRQTTIHLDFLTEPEAAHKTMEMKHLIEVQKDLKACLIKGVSIVLSFNYEENVEATIPDNGIANAKVRVADSVGSLTTKGQAILGRKKAKDYYDIYAITGFHKGGPDKAGKAFAQSINNKGFNISNPLISSSISTIRNSFSSINRIGPNEVSRFIGSDTKTDAYERVNRFLEIVHGEL
ncbi:MAG: hypothetical protein ACFFF9_01845 [Candidatus Thorarchaeota archaeon]